MQKEKRCIVEYRKSLGAEDTGVYVEAVLKLEGLTDKMAQRMYEIFGCFFADVEVMLENDGTDKNWL